MSVNGQCVCEIGKISQNGTCTIDGNTYPDCPPGYNRVNRICVKKQESICQPGMLLKFSICRKIKYRIQDLKLSGFVKIYHSKHVYPEFCLLSR